jgi:hypothetical protein
MTDISNVLDVDNSLQFLGKEMMGTEFLTYVRQVTLEDNTVAYAVCSDEGVQLALFASEEAAYYSARQNNLCPVRVH